MRTLSHTSLLVAILLASCAKDDIPDIGTPLSIDAVINIPAEAGEVTESKSYDAFTESNGLSFEFVHEVTDGIDIPQAGGDIPTKAVQYSTDAQLQNNVRTFRMSAFNANGSAFIQNGTVAYSNSEWTLSGTVPLWNGLETKTFLAYANLPSSGASVSCNSTSQTLTYTVPATAGAQTDILLGYYKGNGDKDSDGKADGYAKLTFRHPLTAVRFLVGDLHSAITGITNISIETAYSKGTLNVTYNSSGTPNYNWGSSLSATTTFSQSVSGLAAKGSQIGTPFILIPQDLTVQRTIVRITVKTTYGSSVIYRVLDTGKWEAGKTNTYTVNCTS